MADVITMAWPTGFPGDNREYVIRLTGDMVRVEYDPDTWTLTTYHSTPTGRRLVTAYPFGSSGAYSKAAAEISTALTWGQVR